MKKRNIPAPDANSVAARIRKLTDRHSLRGIARRTDTPVTNVHRYLNGTTIPAEFCRALVHRVGVNPSWLLTGEGAPYLSDVAEDTGRFAADLLDVVNALNAVSRLRIGSLGGKQHAKTLRELSDAMTRHEELHNRLDKHSRPILRDVLQQLKNALDKVGVNQRHIFDTSELAMARNLSRTAEQLARFCSDPELTFEQLVLQGRLAVYDKDESRVLELSQKAILLASGRGGFTDERALGTLADSVDALHYERRFAEARRIAEATLAAATDDVRNAETGLRLTAFVADIQVATGELRRGMDTLMRIRSSMSGSARREVDAYMATALVYSGAIAVPEAVALGSHHLGLASRVLAAALVVETRDALESAVAYWNQEGELAAWTSIYGDHLLRVLEGGDGNPTADMRRLLKISPAPESAAPPGSFLHYHYQLQTAVCATQFFRVAGKPADARRYFRQSCRVIADLPHWYSLTLTWRALHNRNALELGNKTEQREAREFFRRHVELGYRCFADLVEQPSGVPK